MSKVLRRGQVREVHNTRGNHFKFYRAWIEEVELAEASGEIRYLVQTHWGRIGTNGQRGNPKIKYSLGAAAAELRATLSGKIAKGYRTPDGDDYMHFAGLHELTPVGEQAGEPTGGQVKPAQPKKARTPKPKRLTKAEEQALKAKLLNSLGESGECDFSVL